MWTSAASRGNEPPPHVTAVRAVDEHTAAIRSTTCAACGPPGSLWAYVLVNGHVRDPEPPPPDRAHEHDAKPWVCWHELDHAGHWVQTTVEVRRSADRFTVTLFDGWVVESTEALDLAADNPYLDGRARPRDVDFGSAHRGVRPTGDGVIY